MSTPLGSFFFRRYYLTLGIVTIQQRVRSNTGTALSPRCTGGRSTAGILDSHKVLTALQVLEGSLGLGDIQRSLPISHEPFCTCRITKELKALSLKLTSMILPPSRKQPFTAARCISEAWLVSKQSDFGGRDSKDILQSTEHDIITT